MSLTLDEVLENLEKFTDKNGISELEYIEDDTKIGKLKVSCIEQVGGEDEGSHYHLLLQVKKGAESAFVKITGYYSSYCGVEFDSLSSCARLVQPKQKTITVYE